MRAKTSLNSGRQAGVKGPGSKATKRDNGYEIERGMSDAGSRRCLAEESNQGGEVGPDVGEEDEGLGAWLAIDGKAFKVPALAGGVAALGGVASAVVELFPGWRADGDVADEATGSVVVEREPDVENVAVVGVGVEVGALGEMKWQVVDGDHGLAAVLTSATTEPLVAAFLEVEAVGGEGVTEGTDRTPFVVIAAQGPKSLVPVCLMGAQVDHPAGIEVLTDDAQDRGIAEGGIPDDVLDVEGGIEGRKLEELSRKGDLLTGVGGGEVVSQDDVEAARGIGEEEGETGIPIAGVSSIGIPVLVLGMRLVGAAVADEAGLRIAGRGSTADGGAVDGVTRTPA